MPFTYCCVPGCSNRGGHLFPKDGELKKKWLNAIKRNSYEEKHKEWTPSKSSVVCHDHFLQSDYTSSFEENIEINDPCTSDIGREECVESTTTPIVPDAESHILYTAVPLNSEFSCQTPPWVSLAIENFRHDDAGVLFYTGLANYNDFKFVLASLGEGIYHMNYMYNRVDQLNIENHFFLTLIKLRRHKTNFELSRLLSISEHSVTNIWITWLNFMSGQWKELDLWPSRDLVRFFSPSDFKLKFPSTRLFVDGTEMPVKKPKSPIAQQSTYSTYKNRNTVKVLVGCSPSGLVSYVSDSYGGSVSDRQIVERSNLINLCDPGDSIMADKGFNVQDLFAPSDVTINIPTFFKKRNRMTGKTVLRDRKISSKHVHIERIIGLAKTFKILTVAMNRTETKLSSDIIFVVFMLCNFRQCIIPRHA
ncbi:Hypothetical predicted protein [Mytilus galloprovincialis]|uniref:THAP-type domain-containing protein n=2 Tax=Mytilus galloprovincialis TaxID=29158 RepID=A0A8B6F3S2_MYTGA|nr:Hypothetical predicted protein [Mytilus galloprovincialis]